MLFRRKAGTSTPETIVLPVLNGADSELAQKLATEIRVCSTCNYRITNPMNDRCPRCFSMIPLSEHTNCGECSHQGNCTYADHTTPHRNGNGNGK